MQNHASIKQFVKKCRTEKRLIVQPRMGFSELNKMTSGLLAVKSINAPTIGTITLDSYTRVNQYKKANAALDKGEILNGYPIVSYGAKATAEMLKQVMCDDFVVQVRHGTALPKEIFQVLIESGISATEGGPVSYCLPYSRVTLANAVQNWQESCYLFAKIDSNLNRDCHIESFGGCMLGQLCPPSLLIAIGILECLFFKIQGIQSVSLSYAQGTNFIQDLSALKALRNLADIYLDAIDWHVVMYAYMGLFPETVLGSYKLISTSAQLATLAGCERLIVKTPAEAHRIPTIEENVASLELSYAASREQIDFEFEFDQAEYEIIFQEAQQLIQAVLNLHADIGQAFIEAFQKGLLDVPYCLHRENHNRTRSYINELGYLKWACNGNLPISKSHPDKTTLTVNSRQLLHMLKYVRKKYDEDACMNSDRRRSIP